MVSVILYHIELSPIVLIQHYVGMRYQLLVLLPILQHALHA